MAIRFLCTSCGKKLKAQEADVGVKVQCTGCGAVVVVPQPAGQTETQAAGSSKAVFAPTSAEEEEPLRIGGRTSFDDEMDMTPMIDMTFLLLIFFMVTASFALQKSIQMPTPDSTEGVSQSRDIHEIEADDDYIVVRIDSDNTVWVNDVVAPSRQELLFKIREAVGEGTQGPGSMMVVASGDARHETVIMALDCGTAAGLEDVRLTTGEDEDF